MNEGSWPDQELSPSVIKATENDVLLLFHPMGQEMLPKMAEEDCWWEEWGQSEPMPADVADCEQIGREVGSTAWLAWEARQWADAVLLA